MAAAKPGFIKATPPRLPLRNQIRTCRDFQQSPMGLQTYFRVPCNIRKLLSIPSDNPGNSHDNLDRFWPLANFKVEEAQTVHINQQFDVRGPITADSDRLDIYFYVDEVVDDFQYDIMMQHYRDNIDSKTLTSKAKMGYCSTYQGTEFQVFFQTPKASPMTTRLTWRQLSGAVNFMMQLVADCIQRKTLFQGRIWVKDGLLTTNDWTRDDGRI